MLEQDSFPILLANLLSVTTGANFLYDGQNTSIDHLYHVKILFNALFCLWPRYSVVVIGADIVFFAQETVQVNA